MRGLAAPLSLHEGAALRKIGFGLVDALAPEHVRRLLDLELIEWQHERWDLMTTLGRERYKTLVIDRSREHPCENLHSHSELFWDPQLEWIGPCSEKVLRW